MPLRFFVIQFGTTRQEKNRGRIDWAGLRIGRLIPKEKVSAAKLFPKGADLPENGTLLGYGSMSNKSLHGRFDGTLERTRTIGVFVSDCVVTSGNSGGPLMVKDRDECLLVGIIVARNEPSGSSILVEINDWLRELIWDAQKREAMRTLVAA